MKAQDDSESATGSSRGPAGGPLDDATVISPGDSASSFSGASALGSQAAERFAAQPGRSPTAEIGRLLEGSMLGPYRLDEFVGGGGMGAVFRALDTTLDRTVAVKVLARQQSDDEETLRRFRNEAQSAARLDHENIGRVHAVGSEGGWHYIVFQYIEGTNIRDLVREEGPFDPDRTIDITIQVAEALEHASQREIVHRDIKPSNIVITPAGRARIVDMGLARLHQVAGDADLTVSGMTLGTFDYISPEQARDPRAADVRSDLYSLGCTMFFMLAGRAPFAEGTMVQKLLQHQQAEPPAIEELRPEVPRRLAAIVHRLMEKDPLDRYQRAAVLVADLLACADAEGYQLSSPRPAASIVPSTHPSASRLPWLLPAVLLGVLVAGLWLRSAVQRQGRETAATEPDAPEVINSPPLVPAADPRAAVRRVTAAGEFAAAVNAASDGGTIEIDLDGVLDVPAFTVASQRIVIEAAAGRQPILRLTPASDGSGVRLAGGELVLRNLAVHLGDHRRENEADESVRSSLFLISGGRLSCEAAVLRMPGGFQQTTSLSRPAAFVHVSGGEPIEAGIVFSGVRAAGDADLLEVAASAGGRIDFQWNAGAIVTPRRLLASEGTRASTQIECSLENVVAVCGEGLVLAHDSVALPLPARLRMNAAGCRFVVTDPTRPFVEWSGIGTPAEYAAAWDWQDRHGRYEGGAVFVRIDGAAERIELPFSELATPLVHEPTVGSHPQPPDWAGWEP